MLANIIIIGRAPWELLYVPSIPRESWAVHLKHVQLPKMGKAWILHDREIYQSNELCSYKQENNHFMKDSNRYL